MLPFVSVNRCCFSAVKIQSASHLLLPLLQCALNVFSLNISTKAGESPQKNSNIFTYSNKAVIVLVMIDNTAELRETKLIKYMIFPSNGLQFTH